MKIKNENKIVIRSVVAEACQASVKANDNNIEPTQTNARDKMNLEK